MSQNRNLPNKTKFAYLIEDGDIILYPKYEKFHGELETTLSFYKIEHFRGQY